MTERPDPRFSDCDLWPASRLVRELIRAQEVNRAVLAAAPQIARAAALFAKTWKRGGRIFLAGAGTSGRLAAMEAAECPPTFGTDPRRIIAVMAGGARAFHRAVEGAEDDTQAASRALAKREFGPRDLLIGVSASRATPFVRGALERARALNTATILVTCLRPEGKKTADLTIPLVVGPEPIAGSTRMKAGTATKICLNTITTAAMVKLHRSHGNRMVCVRSGSAKLRARAVRLVGEIGGVSASRARAILAASGWDVRTAILGARGVSPALARRLLARHAGSLRKTL